MLREEWTLSEEKLRELKLIQRRTAERLGFVALPGFAFLVIFEAFLWVFFGFSWVFFLGFPKVFPCFSGDFLSLGPD